LDLASIGTELDPRTGPVLLSGVRTGQVFFFCKWGGYPVDDVSYSPLSKLGSVDDGHDRVERKLPRKKGKTPIAVKRQETVDRCCVHTIKYIPTVEYILIVRIHLYVAL
jgi:hypothetical protein